MKRRPNRQMALPLAEEGFRLVAQEAGARPVLVPAEPVRDPRQRQMFEVMDDNDRS